MKLNKEPENFRNALREKTSDAFVEYLAEAIKTKNKLNYNDRFPRDVLLDAELTGETLTLFFENSEPLEIDFSTMYISQSNSAPKKFYINRKGSGDSEVIIFNC